MKPAQIVAQIDNLPENEQEEVKRRLGVLDPGRIPATEVAGIWRIVLLGLIFLGVVSLLGGILLVWNGNTAEPLWPFVTLIIGGLVGLVAPSPVAD